MELAFLLTNIIILIVFILVVLYFLKQLGDLIWIVFEIKEDYDDSKTPNIN